MKVIHKYQINKNISTTLHIEEGSEILSIQNQSGKIQMWVSIDDEAEKSMRKFTTVFTGQEEPGNGKFIGTVQVESIVYHIFELL